jgi:hypothetical protein
VGVVTLGGTGQGAGNHSRWRQGSDQPRLTGACPRLTSTEPRAISGQRTSLTTIVNDKAGAQSYLNATAF